MKNLNLTLPLCFFDVETTGLDIMKDKIVSIAIRKQYPDNTSSNYYTLINPGIPIPEEVSKIHGITNEMVADKPYFNEIVDFLWEWLSDSDLAGYNSNNFDIPILSMEFSRCGIPWPAPDTKFIDVGNLYKKLNPRTLSAAYTQYTGKNLDDAHNAQADVDATFEVFNQMLQNHDEFKNMDLSGIESLSSNHRERVDICGKFQKDSNGYLYAFGKHLGQRITFSNVEYLGWMINKGDFHPDTIRWARKIYQLIMENK